MHLPVTTGCSGRLSAGKEDALSSPGLPGTTTRWTSGSSHAAGSSSTSVGFPATSQTLCRISGLVVAVGGVVGTVEAAAWAAGAARVGMLPIDRLPFAALYAAPAPAFVTVDFQAADRGKDMSVERSPAIGTDYMSVWSRSIAQSGLHGAPIFRLHMSCCRGQHAAMVVLAASGSFPRPFHCRNIDL